ncbi:ornithine cyclodeaminase family protein [Streptomyces durbertensis]|uniref:Ornithine cyclodeaminase family protein n=1 Tax=Streptomyces durbertensis TaxID=2448886 RepID=A0ABR6E9I1_9ACTN|nr:ornithine cyclodeaminase family protein [Streptomyces durbertensis]MBB1242007.1 ornithine cyclodeaminase family protein [Streptomyces durbertensis]
MGTWVLNERDVAQAVARVGADALMDRVIDRLHEGLAEVGRGTRRLSPQRGGFLRAEPVPGIWEWMPHREPGDSITLKTVGYSPGNPGRFGLPTILGTVARYDDTTGALTALVDGVLLTAVRTGAASAVASRLLAAPDSRVVGLVGAGAQSVTQLHALTRVFPVERVLVWDVDVDHLASFRERVAFLDLEVRPAQPAEIVAESDIVCTATSVPVGAGPVLPADVPHRPHLHVNAVGADLVGKTELPLGLLRRAHVVPDHPEQARHEGECQRLTVDELDLSLGELCARPELAEERRGRLTVFDSTGFALEDHLAMEVLLEVAAEYDLGTRLRIEHHPADALNPYALASVAEAVAGDRG